MESTIEQNTMKACQQTKAIISQNMKDYLDFAIKTLDDEEFVKSATALLPFDNFADARLRFMDDSSRVKSMGLSLMKNELEPARYSLGVSIELAGDDASHFVEQADAVDASQLDGGVKLHASVRVPFHVDDAVAKTGLEFVGHRAAFAIGLVDVSRDRRHLLSCPRRNHAVVGRQLQLHVGDNALASAHFLLAAEP